MRFSEAARVGITVLIGLAILAALPFWLRSGVRRNTYLQQVAFDNAKGIQQGGYVRVRGVDMGTVHAIGLGPNQEAELTLRMSEAYRIQPNDMIRIVGGITGFDAPYVEITPGGRGATTVRTPSGTIKGDSGPTTDQLVSQGQELLSSLNSLATRMDRLAKGLTDMVEDPSLRRSFRTTAGNFARVSESGVVIARNMETATARIDRLLIGFQSATNGLDRTLRQAERTMASFRGTGDQAQQLMADTRGVVKETGTLVRNTDKLMQNASGLVTETRTSLSGGTTKLNTVMDSLNASLKQLDATLGEARTFLADEELRGNLKAMSGNLKDATANLKSISEDVKGLTGDPEVQESLKGTLIGLRQTVAEVSDLFKRVRGVLGGGDKTARTIGDRLGDTEFNATLTRGLESARTRLDFNATIPWSQSTFYRLGFYDFGETNRFNVQMGQQVKPNLWARGGIYASKLGLGLDLGRPTRPTISADLFGVDRPQLDVRGHIRLAPYLDLTLGLDRIFRSADPVIGVRYSK